MRDAVRDVPVQHDRQESLHRVGAQRLGLVDQGAMNQFLGKVLHGTVQAHRRRRRILSEDDGKLVADLDNPCRRAAENEIVRMVYAGRKELERPHEKLLEPVP